MKVFLLISLLVYSLCEVLFLEKYGETIALASSGCICLPLSEFEKGESINLVFSATNGGVSDYIYYGYSNIDDPTEATCDEIAVNKDEAHSSAYSQVYGPSGSSSTIYYYYFFDKKNDGKYMLIKYEDFVGKYLLIESSRLSMSLASIIIITVFSFIGLVALVVMFVKNKDRFKCKICEKEKNVSSDFINYDSNTKDLTSGMESN